jgi:hypothetical protein
MHHIRRSVKGKVAWFLFVIAAFSIAGCASTPDDVAVKSSGWREGWIHAIVAGKDFNKNATGSECVATLSSEQIAANRFAVVRYHVWRKSRPRTVLMPESSDLQVGDKVRINIDDCTASISRLPK